MIINTISITFLYHENLKLNVFNIICRILISNVRENNAKRGKFLNAEIVILPGNLLYSRVIYLKKLVSCWMLCARKRVTSTKIYVASHKSLPQKREIGISVTSEVQFPQGARFSFQEIVAVRGEWCLFLYFPWNLIVRVPSFFFFHTMLIHTHCKLLAYFPSSLVKYPRMQFSKEIYKFGKKFSRGRYWEKEKN